MRMTLLPWIAILLVSAVSNAQEGFYEDALPLNTICSSTNPIFTGILTLPVADDPTTDAEGEIAVDRDGWGTTNRDAIEFFDGTISSYLVNTVDTPANTEVPMFRTGGPDNRIEWRPVATLSETGGNLFINDQAGQDGGGITRWTLNTLGRMELAGYLRADTINHCTLAGCSTDIAMGDGTTDYVSFSTDDGYAAINSGFDLKEKASHTRTVASGGYAAFWAKNTVPTTPWFQDDTGVDYQLAPLDSPNFTTDLGIDNLTLDASSITTDLATGVLTLAGSAGNAENITIDFNTTNNEVDFSSTSGAAEWDFVNIRLKGNISLKFNKETFDIAGDSAKPAEDFRDSYYFMDGNANQTLNLPAAEDGLKFCVMNVDFADRITVNPDDADNITLDGTTASNGEAIYNSSEAIGDYLCMVTRNTTNWYVLNRSGTWVEETP